MFFEWSNCRKMLAHEPWLFVSLLILLIFTMPVALFSLIKNSSRNWDRNWNASVPGFFSQRSRLKFGVFFLTNDSSYENETVIPNEVRTGVYLLTHVHKYGEFAWSNPCFFKSKSRSRSRSRMSCAQVDAQNLWQPCPHPVHMCHGHA